MVRVFSHWLPADILFQIVVNVGMVLGVMPLLMESKFEWQVGLIAVATVLGKGLLIPGLLRRASRR